MAITRSQIPKQIEGKLRGARDEKKKKKRVIASIKRKKNQLITTASADVPLKGLIYLIRAYSELLNEFPDLSLVVIGKLRDGPTSNELDKKDIIYGVDSDFDEIKNSKILSLLYKPFDKIFK